MEYAHQMLAIECVNALFWNYTRNDIQHLKTHHRDFAHVWDTYIDHLSGQDAFNMLWECWMVKFNLETKNGLISYALEKYGAEKQETLETAYQMRNFWKRFEDGN